MTTAKTQRYILLGQIGPAHGIRGEFMVRAFTANPADITAYGPLTDRNGGTALKLKIVRVTDKGVVARADGVNDRNAAEALRGRELYVARDKLPKARDGDYYHVDLIGLRALTTDGKDFGRVVSVENFGAGDLLEIEIAGGKTTEFFQFTNAVVPNVDLEAGTLTIIPPVMSGEPEPAGEGGDEGESNGENSD